MWACCNPYNCREMMMENPLLELLRYAGPAAPVAVLLWIFRDYINFSFGKQDLDDDERRMRGKRKTAPARRRSGR